MSNTLTNVLKTAAQLRLETRGKRVLREVEEVPRFKRSRQAQALIDAIRYGDSDLALWLLRHGFDHNAKDKKGRSALWQSARSGRSGVTRELVRLGANLPDDVLMFPVRDRNVEDVRLLIRHGANVNCVARDTRCSNRAPKEVLLTVAIEGVKQAKILERIGPSIDGSGRNPETLPIMLIKAGANVDRLMWPHTIEPPRVNRSMMGLAAMSGLLKTVKAMIAAGADVNYRDSRRRTALFDALWSGQFLVAKTLVRAGAKLNLKDDEGRTPLESLKHQDKSWDMFATALRIKMGVEVEQAVVKAQATEWLDIRSRMIAFLEDCGKD